MRVPGSSIGAARIWRWMNADVHEAYEHFSRVSDDCAASADYNRFADLFTNDCTYIEHVFGEMYGQAAVRKWIVPLLKQYPIDQVTYTHDWALFDDENGRVIFCARTHMPDLGDGRDRSCVLVTHARCPLRTAPAPKRSRQNCAGSVGR